MLKIFGKKIIKATMMENMAETKTIAEATSLAIFASALLSRVIKSTIASIEVLTISAMITMLMVNIRMSHSFALIDK